MNGNAITMAAAVENGFVMVESRQQQNSLPESPDNFFTSVKTAITFPGNPAVRFAGIRIVAIIRHGVSTESRQFYFKAIPRSVVGSGFRSNRIILSEPVQLLFQLFNIAGNWRK
jgi:hypothetical protein